MQQTDHAFSLFADAQKHTAIKSGKMQKIKAKPFLKRAGSKGQLISQFQEYYPNDLYSRKIEKYIEPFIGGGAIFFDIMQNFDKKPK